MKKVTFSIATLKEGQNLDNVYNNIQAKDVDIIEIVCDSFFDSQISPILEKIRTFFPSVEIRLTHIHSTHKIIYYAHNKYNIGHLRLD